MTSFSEPRTEETECRAGATGTVRKERREKSFILTQTGTNETDQRVGTVTEERVSMCGTAPAK